MVAKEKIPVKLSPKEWQAVQKLLSQIKAAYGKQIRQAMLFGSKARGNASKDSDIDILLLIEKETWELRDEIVGIAADINLEADLLIDVRVIGIERWQQMAKIQSGLYRTISEDAIPLAG
jgi:predicted nucleotidyltransferase